MNPLMIVQFLILQTIFFGIVIFVLKKVLHDDTKGAVNRLNKETEEVRAKQAELNEKIKLANEELERRKKEADALVAKMTDEATEKAKEEREKLVSKARQEGEEIIAKAQATKEAMRKQIQKDVETKMVDFSVEILNTVLTQKSGAALHDSLIEDFLTELAKIDMAMITGEVNEAEIITAVPIEKKNKERLSAILKEKLKRDINIKTTEDIKIVSGAILRFGSLVLDGSLHNFFKEAGVAIREKIEKN